MIFVILYKYLNCAVDKTIDNGGTTSADANINYRIILLITLLINSLERDSSREICTYAT